jgi:Na+-driven multidrug efflux pump
MFQVMSFAVFLTVLLGVLLIWRRQPLVSYLLPGADREIVDGALLYFTGFCISFPFFAFYQAFAGAMRGWGRSGLAWRLTLSVNAAELALIAILLIGFNMGLRGVTLAVVLSRVFGAFHAAFLIVKSRGELELKPLSSLAPNPAILKSMLIIAVPLALEQFFFNSGKAFSQRYIAGYGAGHMAANGVVNAVFDIFNLPQITFREALVIVVGMCVGCGQYKLARRYVYRFMRVIRKLIWWLMPVTIPLAVGLVYSFRLPPQSNFLAFWSLAIIYISGPYLLAGSLTIPAALRGGGDAAFVSLTALGCMWGVRVIASWLFAGVLGLGVVGLNIAMVLDWLARNYIFRARLKGKVWYSRKLIAGEIA